MVFTIKSCLQRGDCQWIVQPTQSNQRAIANDVRRILQAAFQQLTTSVVSLRVSHFPQAAQRLRGDFRRQRILTHHLGDELNRLVTVRQNDTSEFRREIAVTPVFKTLFAWSIDALIGDFTGLADLNSNSHDDFNTASNFTHGRMTRVGSSETTEGIGHQQLLV